MDPVLAVLILGALLAFGHARRRGRAERALAAVGALGPTPPLRGHRDRSKTRWMWLVGAASAVAGASLGLQLMGPLGLLFAGAGPALPLMWARRRRRREREDLEGQLGELAATIALGARSGLSIPQCLELAAEDAEPPMAPLLARMLDERSIGTDLGSSLNGLADAIDTDDARLLVLILLTHARSGGNLASALHEVATTIKYRVEARRELRAMTAQGRISGAILGALPIGFFVILAVTSGNDLAPVYRSPAGIAMVVAGLVLEGMAYLWIRRLLQVEA
jgi:tight adherence protein B